MLEPLRAQNRQQHCTMQTGQSMPDGSTYHASDGASYELFLGRWTKALAPHLLDFAEFSSDGPLLDVGTGTGSMALAMAARWPGRSIVAIDIAEPYIAF